jgi:gluconolactonase
MPTRTLPALLVALCLSACSSSSQQSETDADPGKSYPTLGQIERLDPALDALIAPDAKIEKLTEGYEWAEGPVWVKRDGGSVLFSDVVKNTVHKWDRTAGTAAPYLSPSGYTGPASRGGEPGSNGLTLDPQGKLVLCQHGDRRVARLNDDGKTFTTVVDKYQGKRFNSPNDLVYARSGNLYFTDPPYGLEKQNDDPKKELDFNGVYLLRKDGELVLLTKEFTFPNGVALSPDEKKLYVAQSDPKTAILKVFDVKGDGTIANGRVLFDATSLVEGRKGLPDGLKTDAKGNVWMTGPGGVLVITPEGKHLGTINTGEATANCGWGGDGSELYITADMYLCRVKTATKGKLP